MKPDAVTDPPDDGITRPYKVSPELLGLKRYQGCRSYRSTIT